MNALFAWQVAKSHAITGTSRSIITSILPSTASSGDGAVKNTTPSTRRNPIFTSPHLHASASISGEDDAVINHKASAIMEPPAMPALPRVSPSNAKANRLENMGCVV
jgi:hypothetical protein